MTRTVGGLPTPEMLVATPKEIARPLRGQPEKIARLAAAAMLAAYGFRRGGLWGWGAMLAGSALAVSAKNVPAKRWKKKWVTAESVVTIAAAPGEVYEHWDSPEDLPRHIYHLSKVERAPHAPQDVFLFTARVRESGRLQWKARCIDRLPGERIMWESVRDADLPWTCAITFQPAPKGRGTELRVRMTYGPPGGLVGSIAAGMADDEEPGRSLAQDLRRFKQLLETGEVATTEGQPRGGLGYRLEPVAPRKYLPGSELHERGAP